MYISGPMRFRPISFNGQLYSLHTLQLEVLREKAQAAFCLEEPLKSLECGVIRNTR